MISVQRAKETVTILRELNVDNQEVLNTAIEAVEHFIPKKPINKGTYKICPSCKAPVFNEEWPEETKKAHHQRVCWLCGQKFTRKSDKLGDWYDEY